MAEFNTALLLPAIVQAIMVMGLGYVMGGSRFFGARLRKVDMREVRKTGRWPGRLGVLSDSFNNQFQVPQLFYLACIVLTLIGEVTPLTIALAWAFVVSRLLHTLWHNSKNIIIVRFSLFVLSGTILTATLIVALVNLL